MADDNITYNSLLAVEAFDKDRLDKYQNEAKQASKALYDYLLDKDLLSDENIGKSIADFLKFPFVVLSKYPVKKDVVRYIPQEFANRHNLIVFDETPQEIFIASDDPNQQMVFANIAKKFAKKAKIYFATKRDIGSAHFFYEQVLEKSFLDLLSKAPDAVAKDIADQPIDKIVNLLIEHAYKSRASDIHIEPEKDFSLIRFRIDGMLHDVLKAPIAMHDQIIFRIKVMAKLRTDEHNNAQDGKLQTSLTDEVLDLRVSITPTVDGEKVVLRLLSEKSRQFSLQDLGMKESDLNKVKKAMAKPWGMILSTGPTGSGKTTTIYSMIKILNTRDINIATIENPVEYEMDGVNQIQVNNDTNLTFANGLRSILRQDPDIIFVGEIRDEETAAIAVNSAMTGHLVLSTLHTNDAATALPRFFDLKVKPFLIASTVNIIIGQRLIRKICDKCRVSYTPNEEDLAANLSKEYREKYFATKLIRLYRGKGCPVCHDTGYAGRVGIFEILEVSEAIRDLVNANADSKAIFNTARKEGMTTLLEDGLEKVQMGITTLDEILRVTTF